MITSLPPDPEPTLLAFARRWCTLLANDDWPSALAMIDEPNTHGIVWTRESILHLLNDTFSEDTVFAREHGAPFFSAPSEARGVERLHIGELADGGFWFDYEVPLNGWFSDLTAQFEAHPRAGGFAVLLHDLHVM